MKIAYLVNQYPHTSHSFIRREIAAVEACRIDVRRFSIRRPAVDLVDPGDVAESGRTRVVLDAGALRLLADLLRVAPRRPGKLAKAVWLAMRLGTCSDRGVLRHLIYVAEACVLLDWFREAGVAHVHAHFGTNSTTVALLCRVLGGPAYSFTVHGPDEFDRPFMIRLAEKVAAANFVVAISQYTRSQLCRWSRHEHWKKIQVVHCGLDSMFLDTAGRPSPRPSPAGGRGGAQRLVCVGRLSEQKGQLVLIEATAALAAEGRREFEVVLVGDGPMRGAIEKLIREHELETRVRLAGWMSGEQVRDEMASRAMVLPSFAEGLPVVLMESLALGRPVISTYVAGIPELVQPGVNGWLVPAGSVEALAEAMREALETPVQRLEEMGRAGAQRAREMHDASKEAARLAELFRASIEGRPIGGPGPRR